MYYEQDSKGAYLPQDLSFLEQRGFVQSPREKKGLARRTMDFIRGEKSRKTTYQHPSSGSQIELHEGRSLTIFTVEGVTPELKSSLHRYFTSRDYRAEPSRGDENRIATVPRGLLEAGWRVAEEEERQRRRQNPAT